MFVHHKAHTELIGIEQTTTHTRGEFSTTKPSLHILVLCSPGSVARQIVAWASYLLSRRGLLIT